jgi:ubiquinone/menaquinone biosynthesis C-methylase UbiE
VSLAAFDPNEPVLDVATGSGRMAATLSVAGYSVLSGDIDPDALERTRIRLTESGLDGVELIGLDATCIPFEDEFASVVCANAIHHMTDPILSISEMTKACAKGGKLAIIEFNSRGYEVIGTIHESQNKATHERGSLDSQGIAAHLALRFANVEYHRLDLNNVWIASQKRPSG